jgi:hypothetical protein
MSTLATLESSGWRTQSARMKTWRSLFRAAERGQFASWRSPKDPKDHGRRTKASTSPPHPDVAPTALATMGQEQSPVARLRNLLLERLSEEQIRHLIHSVSGTRPYTGATDARLAEALTRADDLRELLVTHIGAHALAEIATEKAGTPEDAATDAKRCGNDILRFLGFTVVHRPDGLVAHRQELLRLQQRAEIADDKTVIAGTIAQGGAVMERLLRQLLEFHCQHAFDKKPDRLVTEKDWLESSYRVARASLGVLLSLVGKLSAALVAEEDSLAVRRHQEVFGGRPLIPSAVSSLAEQRNKLVHDREELRGLPRHEVANIAAKFFESALLWADHCGADSPPLLPMVVTVEKIVIDKWGRKTAECKNEYQKDERIHTDQELTIGRSYFMHPQSNPVRIFPLLIPAS